MAKTIWRGARGGGRPIRQSKTVSVYGKRRASDDKSEYNIPIPGEWLVDTRLKSELPQLNICKIRPERLRDMTLQQLERVRFFIGEPTKKELYSQTNPRGLVTRLVRNLIGERTVEPLSPRSAEAYRRNYGEEPPDDRKIIDGYKRDADRVELKIFDAQAKAKCKLPGGELVARDAIREGRSRDIVDAARGKRKPKIR